MIREIWTSSYVLYTTGFALLGWGLCYWIIEVKKWTGSWTKPLAAYGVSCIFVFLASHILGALPHAIRIPAGGENPTLQTIIIGNLFRSWLSPQNASLLFALCVVLLWLAPLWFLYSKNKILKI
jgi:predicted acyltransferase